jgi:hypothetical protein
LTELTCPDPACAALNPVDAEACSECDRRLGLVFVDAGYRYLCLPGHPLAQKSGKIREHRLIAAAALGRPLRAGEVEQRRASACAHARERELRAREAEAV